ncbi:MAG: PLP-dependent aminotransferase family protein [Clostridia bacterium]|nr:PLP-dependent aminotransferase family protein [Clostridia bacterium]
MFDYASRLDGLTGNAIREIFKLLAVPDLISFAGGLPSRESFDPGLVGRTAVELMEKNGYALMQYGATEGWGPLLESLRGFLAGQGLQFEADEVLPTAGSMQAFDLLCRALLNPGDVVLVEDPTFLGALHTLRLSQAQVLGVPLEDDGIALTALEEKIVKEKPKFIYLIPTFQNPTGITMSLAKRRAVANMAAKYKVLIAEDDPYRDLRYTGDALPPIASFGHGGYVIYLGSFSKIISPGLRVGYAAGNAGLIRKMTIVKQGADTHSPLLNQAIVDSIIRQGLLPCMIKNACAGYEKQLNAMLAGLEKIPALKYTKPQGGLFVWAELPEGADALELLPRAVEKGVAFIPGTHFYCDGGHANTMRLNFSACPPETITRGTQILRQVLAQQ